MWLPKNWKPTKRYPVYVHWYPSFGYDMFSFGYTKGKKLEGFIRERGQENIGGKINHERESIEMLEGNSYAVRPRLWIHPERDGLMNMRMALEAFEQTFTSDPDRWYWEGGSWGSAAIIQGVSVWPDRFAAVSPNLYREPWGSFFPGVPKDSVTSFLELCGSRAERNSTCLAMSFNPKFPRY